MRSPRPPIAWLAVKEGRELLAAPSWWVLFGLIGPLVGVTFGGAVRAYAEVSAGAGAGCGVVCTPLIGVWGPTLGAYEIAAIFLLPFVAIRAVSGDRQSGALRLELQHRMSPVARVAVKAAVLLGAWLATGLAFGIALACWLAYGGHVAGAELAVALAGHALNGALTIAFSLAVAAATDHPSTAAIVTLAATIGTWVVAFAAAISGGVWDRLAAFTPTALVSVFQHGLLQADVVAVVVVVVVACLVAAAAWYRLDLPASTRAGRTAVVAVTAAAAVFVAGRLPGAWDLTLSRYNSFPEAAEEALERLPAPLVIEGHLAPQDPRRRAFERGPLAKLRRAVPDLRVSWVARTGTGLYESADPGYGRIHYAIGDRETSSYVVTDEGVLETVLGLIGGADEADETGGDVVGYPLVATPTGVTGLFFLFWPAATAGLWWFTRRWRTGG